MHAKTLTFHIKALIIPPPVLGFYNFPCLCLMSLWPIFNEISVLKIMKLMCISKFLSVHVCTHYTHTLAFMGRRMKPKILCKSFRLCFCHEAASCFMGVTTAMLWGATNHYVSFFRASSSMRIIIQIKKLMCFPKFLSTSYI